MQASWKMAGEPLIMPAESVVWSLVGAAFDYRVRYFFTITPPDQFVAAHGAGLEMQASFFNLATALTTFIENNNPCRELLPLKAEALLARYCYVLAMYESLFRATIVNSPLFSLRPGASANEQLTLAPSADIADLVALAEAAAVALEQFFVKPMIANPKFAGSNDVGGADADLIIENCLIDIKTTKSKSLGRDDAYQLVGYTLLDYEDEYGISSLGFYLSRIPALITWPTDEAIEVMSNGVETVGSLRNSLKSLLAQK